MLGDPPLRDPVVTSSGAALGTWGKWFLQLRKAVVTATATQGATRLSGQGTSLASTPVQTPSLSAGLYRVSYYARITRAATTSSSLTVTINWTDNGVACSSVGAAMTLNTTATVQTGTVTVRIDAMTTLRYATAYVSVGGTTMLYQLDVFVEALEPPF